MPKEKPCCQQIGPWLKDQLGKGCLAPLTGTDSKALTAAVHILELYSYHRHATVLQAFGDVVRCMHKIETQELAYHAIAMVLNWEDRPTIWLEAGLPEFRPRICAWEPGGSARRTAPAEPNTEPTPH